MLVFLIVTARVAAPPRAGTRAVAKHRLFIADVWMGTTRGASKCAACGIAAAIRDRTVEQTRRRPDTCRCRTHVHARLPGTACREHGVRQAAARLCSPREPSAGWSAGADRCFGPLARIGGAWAPGSRRWRRGEAARSARAGCVDTCRPFIPAASRQPAASVRGPPRLAGWSAARRRPPKRPARASAAARRPPSAPVPARKHRRGGEGGGRTGKGRRRDSLPPPCATPAARFCRRGNQVREGDAGYANANANVNDG
jgi:hypothetical protein